jgi:DNA-binding protein HU-beta
MNKKSLVDEIAKGTGLTRVEVAAVVEGIMALVSRALREGESVELRGFGTFVPVHRAPRRARDPVSGVVRSIPPRWTVVFRPSPRLKNAVNQNHLDK